MPLANGDYGPLGLLFRSAVAGVYGASEGHDLTAKGRDKDRETSANERGGGFDEGPQGGIDFCPCLRMNIMCTGKRN